MVCDVAEDFMERLRKFRFHEEMNNAALIMKTDTEKCLMGPDEECEGISPDELKDELPEPPPGFVIYSYKYQHDNDGRVSYPLCFYFSRPIGCEPEQQMMHAGSKNKLVQTAHLTMVSEIRNTEDLTEECYRRNLEFSTHVNFHVSKVFMYEPDHPSWNQTCLFPAVEKNLHLCKV